MLEVLGYRKVYGEHAAVRGLSFSVEPGQVLGMVGPNGAGKTTTLRAVAGILRPTAGSITVAGSSLEGEPVAARRKLAYVPDDPHLFEALTVWEHLLFTASVYGLSGWEERGATLLDRFELADRRDTAAQGLSRGMRQKLALAMAFLHRPALVMLDEPMTGLDPLGMRRLRDVVREEAARGMAVIISSHQLDLVEDLATHLLVLVGGVSRYLGPMDAARLPAETIEDTFFRLTGGEG